MDWQIVSVGKVRISIVLPKLIIEKIDQIGKMLNTKQRAKVIKFLVDAFMSVKESE